jgi:hypothetical protein
MESIGIWEAGIKNSFLDIIKEANLRIQGSQACLFPHQPTTGTGRL